MFNEELRREVSLQINYLGDSEYTLALSRAEKKDTASIVAEVEKHREQFEQGKTCGIGSATFASAEQWRAISSDSDRAARDVLLQSSPELVELDRLEKAALQAKRLAEAKNRELESAWNEFSRIPERAYAIRLELDGIAKLLSELEPGKAEADFKQQYMQMLNGATADGFAQTALAGLLVTRELRKECLNEKAAELNNELSELKARSKALAKKLGQKSNI